MNFMAGARKTDRSIDTSVGSPRSRTATFEPRGEGGLQICNQQNADVHKVGVSYVS